MTPEEEAEAGEERAEGPREGPGGPDERGDAPSEEEIRRQLEDELRKLRVQDVLLQSVVSLINLSGRRIAKEDERDLEQAKLGIDAVRAIVDLLDPEPARQVKNALSELQMLYAKHAGGAAPASGEEKKEAGAEPAPGERKPSPGLWTPPGSA